MVKTEIIEIGKGLDRVNKIMQGIPGGMFKVVHSALKRAGETAKTRAGQFAAAEYTITKSEFMHRTRQKTVVDGGSGGVAEVKLYFSGSVIPLLTFNTRFSRDGRVETQVKRNGGAATLEHAFVARMTGKTAVYERVGSARFPVEQKYGPSTGHMMQNETVTDQMDKTIADTFEKRVEHEILRVLNGWGG